MSVGGCAIALRVKLPDTSQTRISVSAQQTGGRSLGTMYCSERETNLQEPSVRPRLVRDSPSRSDFALDRRVRGHVESHANRRAIEVRHGVHREVEHGIGGIDVDVLEAVVRLP